MKRIRLYFSTLHTASKFFLVMWALLCMVWTFALYNNKPLSIWGILFFVYGYLAITSVFLLLSITLNESQNASDFGNPVSEYNYRKALLYAIFLGWAGAHRFYVGKKITGVMYLFTLGGFGVGWIFDTVLLATGMFPDHEWRFVRRLPKNPGFDEEEESFFDEISEGHVDFDAEEQVSNDDPYYDIDLDGQDEILEQIPAKEEMQEDVQKDQIEEVLQEPSVSGLKQGSAAASQNVTQKVQARTPRERFILQMEQYESLEGQNAPFVPFDLNTPTYESMMPDEKSWYFYWRSQVRNGDFPQTDRGYIYVYIYELLSGFGWRDAKDGFEKIVAVWFAYRDKFPTIDEDLYDWVIDFCLLNEIHFDMLRIGSVVTEGISKRRQIRNYLFMMQMEENPLKLPFSSINQLCDYAITDSKFYLNGHQHLINSFPVCRTIQ